MGPVHGHHEKCPNCDDDFMWVKSYGLVVLETCSNCGREVELDESDFY